jgi:hypothetical protein
MATGVTRFTLEALGRLDGPAGGIHMGTVALALTYIALGLGIAGLVKLWHRG